MQYKITTKSKSFRIDDIHSGKELVSVFYESIWNSNASFSLEGESYEIKSSNAWQTKFDLFKNEIDIGDIDYNWKGEIIIRLKNNDLMTKHFILKCTNMFMSEFSLKDFLTNKLWSIKAQWEWKAFNYVFYISREEGFEEEENNVDEMELLVAATYAAILYLRMASSASA
jgi:hypothetical protein